MIRWAVWLGHLWLATGLLVTLALGPRMGHGPEIHGSWYVDLGTPAGPIMPMTTSYERN